MSGSVWAQSAQVPIGAQSGTTSYIPIYSCYEYSYSQQLVYSSEINASGDITSISFYYNNGSYTNSINWDVYLGHTSQTTFATTEDWVPFAALEPVFSGIVTFPTEGNWMTITFDDPFSYNGTDNLVIGIDENTSGYDCSVYFGKTADVSGSNRGIYYRSDYNNPDPQSPPTASGRVNYINNMILGGIQLSCPAPSTLAATSITETTATLEWTENGSATEWEVVYGPVGFDPQAMGTHVIVSTNSTTTLTELDINAGYDVYVKSVCDLDDESPLVGPVFFNTPCTAVSVPFIEGFESGNTHNTKLENCWSQQSMAGTNDWTVNSTETIYNRTPRTGSFNVTLRNGNTDWIFYPLELAEGTPYQLKFYARQDGATSTNASVEAAFGTANNDAAMTNSIVPSTPLVNGDYQEMVGYFTPPSSGVYYIGIKGTINYSPWYISLDDLSVKEAGGCLEPSGLTASNISASTVNLSWSTLNSETQWEVLYGESGFDPLTAGIAVIAEDNPETTVTGLSQNTGYHFYVKAICAVGDESTLAGPTSFRTLCGPTTVPYLMDFETASVPNLPECTLRENIETGSDWLTATYTSGGFNSKVLKHGYSSDISDAWFYTQGVELEAGTAYQISYLVGNNNSTDHEKMKVAYGTSPESTAMTNPLADHPDITGLNNATTETITFAVATDGVYYFGFNVYSNVYMDNLYLDDINVYVAPSCPNPFDLAVTTITESLAGLSWAPGFSETDWEVIYGETGFNPLTTGTTVSVSNDPETTITGLSATTEYDFYVTAICGVGDESDMVGPASFKTPCDPGTIPFAEGFESGYTNYTELGNCWSQESISGTGVWAVNNAYTSYNRSPRTGSFNIYIGYNNESWMFYPIYLTSGIAYELKFYARQDGTSGTSVEAAYGTLNTASAMTNIIFGSSPVINGEYQEISGYFSAESSGTYYIGIKGTLTYSPNYLSIDDISVEEAVGCFEPASLMVNNISINSADLSWSPFGSETQWEVIYGETGFDPLTLGTTVTASNDPEITITGLSQDTDYDFYVSAICGVGDESDRVGPVSFRTSCVPETLPFFESFESSYTDNAVLGNCWSQESIAGTSDWRVNSIGTSYNLSPRTGSFNIYLPWSNTDWIFYQLDLTGGTLYQLKFYARQNITSGVSIEAAFGTSNTASAMTNTIIESSPVTNGEYQSFPGYFTPVSSGTYFIGIKGTLNYSPNYLSLDDISVEESNGCFEPGSLMAGNISGNSADLSWTPGGSETQWEVIYGVTGFDPLIDGTTVTVNNNPEITLSNLIANTKYSFYVKAICDANNKSTLTGMVSFRTMCGPMDYMFEGFEDYATGDRVPICWVRLLPPTILVGVQKIWGFEPASGLRNISQYTLPSRQSVIVVLPEFNNTETNWLRFKARRSKNYKHILFRR